MWSVSYVTSACEAITVQHVTTVAAASICSNSICANLSTTINPFITLINFCK